MRRHGSDSSFGFTLVEVVVVLVLLLMVGGGVYVWQQSQQHAQEMADQEDASSAHTGSEPTPTPDPIPAGWVKHEVELCDVTVSIPPKQSPYIETNPVHGDAFWQVDMGVLDSLRPFASDAVVSARFGYAAGTPTGAGDVVGISCSDELDTPVSLEEFKQEYVDFFEKKPPTAEKFEGGERIEITGKISSIEESTVSTIQAVRVEVPDFNRGLDETRFEYLVVANNRQYIISISELGWPGGDTVHTIFDSIRF